MEKPPIINNLKDKLKLGNASPNGDNDDFNDGQTDVLEQFNIPMTIEIPETIMTPNKAGAVKFRYSKPRGFSPSQVEEFYTVVLDSLKFYVRALEKRDKNIHKLATEVDKYKTDFQNTKFQLEMFQGVGKQAVVNDNGGYLSESQIDEHEREIFAKDGEIQNLRNELLMARKDNSLLQRELSEATSAAPSIHSGNGLNDAEREELLAFRDAQASLDEWEEAVQSEYANVQEQLAAALAGSPTPGVNQSVVDGYLLRIQELEETSSHLVQLTEQVKNLEGLVEAKESELAEAIDVANEIEDERLRLASELENSGSSEEIEGLKSNLAGVEATVAEKEAELAQAIDVANQIEVERARLAKEVEKSSKAPIVDNSEEIASLNEYIKSLDEHINTLEEKILKLQNESAEKEAFVAELEAALEEKDSLIEELRSRSHGQGVVQIEGYRDLPPDIRLEDLL